MCLTSGGIFRHWNAAATTSTSRAESVSLGGMLRWDDGNVVVMVEDVEEKIFGRRMVGKRWKRKRKDADEKRY
jgi:hypothetical protein